MHSFKIMTFALYPNNYTFINLFYVTKSYMLIYMIYHVVIVKGKSWSDRLSVVTHYLPIIYQAHYLSVFTYFKYIRV